MEIELDNHDLPEPPLSYTSTTVLKKSHYPGNPDPIVQVLNTKHGTIEFSGEFKDKFHHKAGYALTMIEDLQTMRETAEEVTLEYFNQIFIGMVEEVTPSIKTVHDIGYKIRFNIFRLAHEQVNMMMLPIYEIDIEKMKKQIEALESIRTEFQLPSVIEDQLDQIKDCVEQIEEEAKKMTVSTLASMAAQAAKGLNKIKSVLRDVYNLVTENLKELSYFAEIYNQLNCLKQDFRSILNLNSLVTPQQILHIVSHGETLAQLAQKFLGDARRWMEIANLNGLKDSVINMGQKLVIPK